VEITLGDLGTETQAARG